MSLARFEFGYVRVAVTKYGPCVRQRRDGFCKWEEYGRFNNVLLKLLEVRLCGGLALRAKERHRRREMIRLAAHIEKYLNCLRNHERFAMLNQLVYELFRELCFL